VKKEYIKRILRQASKNPDWLNPAWPQNISRTLPTNLQIDMFLQSESLTSNIDAFAR
jgi:hypothetical protein